MSFFAAVICQVISQAGVQLSNKTDDLIQLPSLDLFYDEHAGWFKERIERRYGREDAEDIVQDTWLRMTSTKSLGEVRHPKAFLLQIAMNLVSNRRRRRELALRAEAAAAASQDRVDANQTDHVMLAQIVLGLPESVRDVFLLSRIDGLTNAQIADRLGISPKTVEGRMTRALAHCAAQLRR